MGKERSIYIGCVMILWSKVFWDCSSLQVYFWFCLYIKA